VTVVVERLEELPLASVAPLVSESERAGESFVRRLVDEWESGANRFDRFGEALFGARAGGRLVGVCGLNRDPYADDASVGRVRHLYVAAAERRRGVGGALVSAVVDAARGTFDEVRLRTRSDEAAAFYESLGFRRTSAVADCTHVLPLVDRP